MDSIKKRLETYPDVSFIEDLSFEELKANMIKEYQEEYKKITGKEISLAPADPERLKLYACAVYLYQAFSYIDKAGNIYEKHPLTNESILWFKIPKWPRIKRYIKQACNEVPEIGYIAWDVSLGEKGPFLIESNEFPGHDLYQLPPHRTNGIGLLPRFEKVLNDYNRNSIEKENN